MAGAQMRELYDAAAKERQKRKSNSVVAKVPQQKVAPDKIEIVKQEAVDSFTECKEVYDQIVEKASGKTRDQVGIMVGVSGRYIDDASKVLKCVIAGLASCRLYLPACPHSWQGCQLLNNRKSLALCLDDRNAIASEVNAGLASRYYLGAGPLQSRFELQDRGSLTPEFQDRGFICLDHPIEQVS